MWVLEGETYKLMFVWISAIAALCYCHWISRSAAVSLRRLLCLLPVVILFILLPLNLTTITFGGLTAFFLAWLANFKLLPLAFGKGPLSPRLSLSLFIATACLPIKLHGSGNSAAVGLKPTANYAIKFLIAAAFISLFSEKERINPIVVKVLYGVFVYIILELYLALAGAIARRLVGVQLEPQFNEPYLSTSLQDFWGRRWNLMVTSILRPSVYDPVRSIAGRWIGRQGAFLAGVFSTFVVSGVMHELMFYFYYIGRREPTWVVTCFFVLHGMSVVAESMVKKVTKRRLPAAVSCPLTVAYVAATGVWLFVPPLLGCGAEAKVQRETLVALQFVKGTWEFLRFSAINILRK